MKSQVHSYFRMLSLVLCLSLFLGLLPTAQAAITQSTYDHADALHELGLFQGTGTGYDLERRFTRVEGVVMLIRLLGQEDSVKNGSYTHPFQDVMSWSDPYIGYAYANKLSNGTSATTFGGTEYMTANQFATFILRALGYSDTNGDFVWSQAAQKTADLGIVSQEQVNIWSSAVYLRGDMVDLSYAALTARNKAGDKTLCQTLVERGIFSEDAAKLAGVWSEVQQNSKASIVINQATAVCAVGGTATVTATVTTPDGVNYPVVWSSSNPAVATVNGGTITGVTTGTAEITASVASLNISAKLTVTVQANTVSVQSVSLSPATLSLTVGGKGNLSASILPANASNKSVTWNSSNPAVATVSGGTVTAIAAGTAVITATAADGSMKKATTTVTVAAKTPTEPKVERAPISEGCYRIKSVANPGCSIDIYNSDKTAGTNAIININLEQESQCFNIISTGGDTFQIAPSYCQGMSLDISGMRVAGNNVQIWETNYTDNQKWFASQMSDGTYTIRVAAQSDLALCTSSAQSGGNLELATYNTQEGNQRWTLERLGDINWVSDANTDHPGQSIADGVYNIQIKMDGRYLNIDGGIDKNGTKVELWDMDFSAAQQFRVQYISDGKYKLYAVCSSGGYGRVLDVNRGSNAAGPLQAGLKVDIWDETDAPAQEFYIEQRWDGYYTIALAALPNCVLSCNSVGANGALIVVDDYQNLTGQHWSFTPAATASTPTAPDIDGVITKLDNVQQQYYDGYALGSNYSYHNRAWQCYGFALQVQNAVFGNDPQWGTDGTPVRDMTLVGRLSIGQYSAENITDLINLACPGDVIQFDHINGTEGTQHAMIYMWRSSTGFGVYDANWGGDNVVHNHAFNFSDFQSSGYANISLLHNNNYPMK